MHFLSNIPSFMTVLATGDLEKTITDLSVTAIAAGSAALLVLVAIAMVANKKWPQFKPALFALIVTVVLGTTITISGGTIYLNLNSASGGPVHWHADIEFWACGNELELRNPQGFLSNKIGTPTLHEHDDKRIHLEGVPVTLPEDASLGKFMKVLGGGITSNSLSLPLNETKHFESNNDEIDGDGPGAPDPDSLKPFIHTEYDGSWAMFKNGQSCGSQPSEVQVFAYKYNAADKTYKQTKVTQPENYEIAHHDQVPPGDCLIVEFAPRKDQTDKLCQQYGIRDIDRCADFGVKPNERHVCELREVSS